MNSFLFTSETLMNSSHRLSIHRGVTLMEVIFAIGAILGGLVGLAALIPLAADNAKATMELDRSISESVSAAALARARSFDDLNELVMFDKPVQGSVGDGRTAHQPTGAMVTVADWLNGGFVTTTTSDVVPLNSPGYGHGIGTDALLGGICIDPLGMPDLNLDQSFASDPSAVLPFVAPAAADSAFDASRFPYFNERYTVLGQPNATIGSPAGFGGLGTANPTRPWPMGPRMHRVTLKSPERETLVTGGLTIPFCTQARLLPKAAINRTFFSSGGVNDLDGDHQDDPKSFQANSANLTDAAGDVYSIDSSYSRTSRYSWFATLAPPFLGGNSFRQSIVIVRDRLPPVPQRLGDPLSLQKTSYPVDSSDDNPEAERLTWVGDAVGFEGGAGGDVQIFGSDAVSDEITTGQWVMLSRQPHQFFTGTAPPPPRASGPAVHRWFKVLRVSDSERPDPSTIPNWPHADPPPVWSRWITLAGPDWAFQDEATGNTTAIDDTFCTIVTGAVSVIESEVILNF